MNALHHAMILVGLCFTCSCFWHILCRPRYESPPAVQTWQWLVLAVGMLSGLTYALTQGMTYPYAMPILCAAMVIFDYLRLKPKKPSS